ncbi:hypothetical protein J0X15_12600 [Roseibium sp. CAU 1637]|uniref:FG-GAP repeat protein n=1 Tax=Roseibium limicola TaxID=2816037 RepID=A0A939EP14_9HYPH|nr:hypothetical protein [Roseibium limicola]MBO0346064.1 hypothetical protein [Roseibium limicola]
MNFANSRILLFALTASFTPLCFAHMPAYAYSNATIYLMDQEISAACGDRGGNWDATSIFEADLNGDGRTDLILDHSGISCNGAPVLSPECGMQVCSIKTYIRRDGLLKPVGERLGSILRMISASPPTFEVMNHGGSTTTWIPGP